MVSDAIRSPIWKGVAFKVSAARRGRAIAVIALPSPETTLALQILT